MTQPPSPEVRAALSDVAKWRGSYLVAYDALLAARRRLATAITGWRKGDLVTWRALFQTREGVIVGLRTVADDTTHPSQVTLHVMPLDPKAHPRSGWHLPGDSELTRFAVNDVSPVPSPDLHARHD